jgi:hypothetical protein
MPVINKWLILLNGKITRRYGQDIRVMHPLLSPNFSVFIKRNLNSKPAPPKALSPPSTAKLGQ